MKICFTVDSMNSGGAERVVSTLANEFVKRGNDVTIIMISSSKNYSFYSLSNKVVLIPLLEKYKRKPKYFKRVRILRKHILTICPDVVISFLSHVCIYTWLAMFRANIPIICCERNDPNSYSRLIKIALKFIFKKTHGCVFQTKDALKYYFKKQNNCKNIVIFNPVFIEASINQTTAKKENSIVAAGRLVPQKNFKLLMDAFEIFSKQKDNYYLKIFGDGPLFDELKRYASSLSCSDRINLLGNSASWHSVARNASLFVLSSDFEGMPNCLAEALALGVPCLSTDCPIGGARDLIMAFGGGKLVPTKDAQTMSQEMIKLVDNPPVTSPDKVNVELSPNAIATTWLNYLNNVLRVNRK